MPPASRRKAKQTKKLKTLTILNHHSDQFQGVAVSANYNKKMEGSLNGTLQDNQKVETQSLSKDKEVVVEVDNSPDGHIDITDEENKELVESGKVGEAPEDVSESVGETFEPDAQAENTMESDTVHISDLAVVNHEVRETDLPSSENNNELFSVSGNEELRDTDVVVVETFVKYMVFGGGEKNVFSSVVSDKLLRESEAYGDSSLPLTHVASEETVLKSGESGKVVPTIIEKSLDEKVEEPSGDSSYESAKESFQPSSSVPDAESSENPSIVLVAQRENTSWKSCCGLFEIMRGGHR